MPDHDGTRRHHYQGLALEAAAGLEGPHARAAGWYRALALEAAHGAGTLGHADEPRPPECRGAHRD